MGDCDNDNSCSKFASIGYNCTPKKNCKRTTLSLREEFIDFQAIVREEAEEATCFEEGMVCCHEENIITEEENFEQQDGCSEYASMGYNCVAEELCKTTSLSLRQGSIDFQALIREEAEKASCALQGLVCCHDENIFSLFDDSTDSIDDNLPKCTDNSDIQDQLQIPGLTCKEENNALASTSFPIDEDGMIKLEDQSNLPPCPKELLEASADNFVQIPGVTCQTNNLPPCPSNGIDLRTQHIPG